MALLFITGTDTGIGKTTIAALCAQALVAQGACVGVIKPVETGYDDLVENKRDGWILWNASSKTQSLNNVVPYSYGSPVAPYVAAKISGEKIEVDRIIDQIHKAEQSTDIVIIEGAGGLLVPLTSTYTYADLIKDLKAHCIVVVGSKLGAINHALLTFEVLAHRKINTLGYVFNDLFSLENKSLAIQTNRELLRELLEPQGHSELAYLPSIESPHVNLSEHPELAQEMKKLAQLCLVALKKQSTTRI